MQVKKYELSNIGENFGSNLIATLFDGEIQRETLKGEGLAALDFQLKYKNFFGLDSVKQIGVQVKTGKSYTDWITTKKCYSLRNIDPNHIEKWKKNNQSVIVLWVNPQKKIDVYWKYIKPTSSLDFLYLTNNNLLRPHSIFEIDRLFTLANKSKNGIPLITLKKFSSLAEVKIWCKKEYSKIKGKLVTDFGIINLTGYAWKHLIRKNRNVTHIYDSLLLLRSVKTILNFHPDQIQTISPNNNPENFDENNNNIVTQKRVLFIYRNVNFSDVKGCTVYIRLKETIIYPKNWRENFFIKGKLQHKLTLESVYRKT